RGDSTRWLLGAGCSEGGALVPGVVVRRLRGLTLSLGVVAVWVVVVAVSVGVIAVLVVTVTGGDAVTGDVAEVGNGVARGVATAGALDGDTPRRASSEAAKGTVRCVFTPVFEGETSSGAVESGSSVVVVLASSECVARRSRSEYEPALTTPTTATSAT